MYVIPRDELAPEIAHVINALVVSCQSAIQCTLIVKDPAEVTAALDIRGSIQHRVRDRLNGFEWGHGKTTMHVAPEIAPQY